MPSQAPSGQIMQYSCDAYNSLPDVSAASAAFQACEGEVIARDLMRDLFRKKNVQDTFGLTLLHRHGRPLAAGERMTAVSGTRSPAPSQVGEPSVWRVNDADGRVIPIEFSFDAPVINWNKYDLQEFAKEFFAVLLEHQAERHFGLCLYPGDGYPGHIDVEDGESTTGLAPEEAYNFPRTDLIEVAWFYTDDHLDRDCKYYCLNTKK
ncbi:hypothetical protein A9K55_000293 [Cordyceps militaris]|uniref:Uncharacterized protein n=1 Tax=Cordyceps militaris TaxID=73501 RepID=A0A2H4SVU8_CORMI|nr:hypothetical protein A9K55_000293 [Cordyceps militaris]